MRVRKKINWMKRMVAAGMAVCMALDRGRRRHGNADHIGRSSGRIHSGYRDRLCGCRGRWRNRRTDEKYRAERDRKPDRQRGNARKGRRDRSYGKRQRDRRDWICGTRQRDRKNRISRKGNTAGQQRFCREQQPDRRHSSVRKCRAENRVQGCRK